MRKMERRTFFPLPKTETVAPYESGTCDFCKQRGVRITALHCKKHFYCRVCEEFSPKFQRGDYRCRVCSERTRKLAEENMQRVDNFFKTKTGGGGRKKNNFEEIAFSLEGSRVITFDTTNDSDDDSDLSGNNDEWEKLLEDLTNEKEREKSQSPIKHKKRQREIKFDNSTEDDSKVIHGDLEAKSPELMNRAMSFIKLVLPSTEPPYHGTCEKVHSEGTPNTPDPGNCDSERQTLSKREDIFINQKDKLPPAKQSELIRSCDSEISSEERSSSPIKAVSRKRFFGWIQSVTNEDEGEDEDIVIEGPGFRYSPDIHIGIDDKQNDIDAFWDS